MKKLSLLLLALVVLTGFNACSSDDDVVFIAQPDTEGISFTNTFSPNYTLTRGTAENIAERFVWNLIDLEVPTNISYELQGSSIETFENLEPLGTTSGNNLAITVQQLLDLAEDAGLDNDPTTDDKPNTGTLYFRVVASAGTAGEMAHITETQALTVVLPEGEGEEEESFRNLFLVGDVTAAGWNPDNNNTPLFRDGENADLYHFTGRFAGGAALEGFKLVETNQWQPQWGLDGAEFTSSDILGGDPTAIPVAEDAYYTFEVDATEMTYSFELYDESGAESFNSIGILGSATIGLGTGDDGWGSDVDLTQSDFDSHIWYANNVELQDGELKIRANDAWDTSWGANTALSGQAANNNDPNIPVVAGVYDIWFNDISMRYILIPQVVAE